MKKNPGNHSQTAIDLKKLPVFPDARKSEKKSAIARLAKKNFEAILAEIKVQLPEHLERCAIPDKFVPMMACTSEQAFDDKEWLFEFHQTGQRAIAMLDGEVKIMGGDASLLNEQFPTVVDALSQWPVSIVLDGVIVNISEEIDAAGEYDEEQFIYYVSDIMWLDGTDLCRLPLHQRKSILMQLIPDSSIVRISDHIDEFGKSFYELANSNSQHGIVAKRKDAFYEKGKRSSNCIIIESKPLETITTATTGTENPEDPFKCDFKNGPSIQIMNIDGRRLLLTNLHQQYAHLQKQDVVNYYCELASYILPYLYERPLELRCSDKLWKSITDQKWIRTFCRTVPGNTRQQRYVIPDTAATLIFLINAGIVELKGWNSRASSPQYPDWAIISVEGNRTADPFLQMLDALHQLLKNFDVPAFPKLSPEGIDVYVPLSAKYNFEQARQFAAIICKMVMEETESIPSSPRKKSANPIIHFEKNQPTIAAHLPFSILKSGSIYTSAPLHWTAALSGVDIENYTIENLIERVKTDEDMFSEALKKGIDLNHLLKGLANLVSA